MELGAMSERERWVVKDGDEYWTGSWWCVYRSEAFVFDTKPNMRGFDESARAIRLRKKQSPRGLLVAESLQSPAPFARELYALNERHRVADWLAKWLEVNKGLLASDTFLFGSFAARVRTEGLVAALEQIIPRIRKGDLATTWAWPP